MGISWRYNQLESSWVILVTSHPLGRNLRYDRPVVMAPGNGKIFHRNINSLIFLDIPRFPTAMLHRCYHWLTSHQFHIHPKPTRHITNHCLILHPMLSSYLCRMLVGWFWIFLLIRGYSWKAKSLALSTLEGCYIKTYQHLGAAYSDFLFLPFLEISSVHSFWDTGEKTIMIHLAGDRGGKNSNPDFCQFNGVKLCKTTFKMCQNSTRRGIVWNCHHGQNTSKYSFNKAQGNSTTSHEQSLHEHCIRLIQDAPVRILPWSYIRYNAVNPITNPMKGLGIHHDPPQR